MSQQWQQPRGGDGGGSVRKARERAQAGAPMEFSSPPRQRPYDQTAPSPPQNRSRLPMPAGFSGSRNEQGQVGVAISRPTQVPQWPLGSMDVPSSNQGQYQPPAGRGVAPQRPPRPSNVPSMLDASRLQDPTPSFQYSPAEASPNQLSRGDYYEDNGFPSPEIMSPTTGSSRQSTVSSVGSIPDFPVPAIPQFLPIQGARRSGNLGPPPSSRRGASSYYSQQSFVSPIPEESPRATLAPSHLSYASSAAIPPNWPRSPSSPGFGYDDYDDYYDRERGSGQGTEDGRISRGSLADDSDDRGLIRSASLGKRAKPSMVTTKSFDKGEDPRATVTPKPLQLSKSNGSTAGLALTTPQSGAQRQTFWPSVADSDPPPMPTEPEPIKLPVGNQRHTAWPTVGNPDSPLASGTGLIDPTPTSSAESVPTLSNPTGVVREKRSSTADPSINPILGAYNAASALNPGRPQARERSPSAFSRFSVMKRPPRLDIDPAREAEVRGSLTSLPDLIRRATKLAAMMDRGKRPGSRMNDLSDFPSDIDLSSRNKEFSPVGNRGSGLSGMLNAFPTARLGTPSGDTLRPQSTWPMGFGAMGGDEKANQNQSTRPRKAGRRCCGMPCWLFLLLQFILLLLIAAAIVIPLYFLVIKKNNDVAATLTPLQQCQKDTATSCQNGGVASLLAGSCSCICINGFTGSTCTTLDQGACSTITLQDNSTSVMNATLGDAIPRLISSSQTNFSIPLSETVLLARFNKASLSCVSQNALVTFNGQSTRVGAANAVIPSTTTKSTRSLVDRQASSITSSSSIAISTATSGIIYDSSPTSIITDSSADPSKDSSTTTVDTSTAAFKDTDFFNITQSVLDFSRVAVLFMFQEESLDNAALAQSNLQRFFGMQSFTNAAARNVSLGQGNSVDLLGFRVQLGGEPGVVGTRKAGVKRRRGLFG